MLTRVPRLLFWTPRVLCMLLAAYLSIFALDVLGHGYGVVRTIVGLFMHLLPTSFLVIIVLVISWRWEWVGAIVYIALGIMYTVLVGYKFPDSGLMISGPAIVIGILFAINAIVKSRIEKKKPALDRLPENTAI